MITFASEECNIYHALAAYGARTHVDRQVWTDTLPNDVSVIVASILAEYDVAICASLCLESVQLRHMCKLFSELFYLFSITVDYEMNAYSESGCNATQVVEAA